MAGQLLSATILMLLMKICKYKLRLEIYLPLESEKTKFDTDLDANIIINNNK